MAGVRAERGGGAVGRVADSGRRPLGAGAVIAIVLAAYVSAVYLFVWYAAVMCGRDSTFTECGDWHWFYGIVGLITVSPVAIPIIVAALWRSQGRLLPRMHQLFVVACSLFALVAWLILSSRWPDDGGPGGWLTMIVPVIVIVALLRIGAGQHASWRDEGNEGGEA